MHNKDVIPGLKEHGEIECPIIQPVREQRLYKHGLRLGGVGASFL